MSVCKHMTQHIANIAIVTIQNNYEEEKYLIRGDVMWHCVCNLCEVLNKLSYLRTAKVPKIKEPVGYNNFKGRLSES